MQHIKYRTINDSMVGHKKAPSRSFAEHNGWEFPSTDISSPINLFMRQESSYVLTTQLLEDSLKYSVNSSRGYSVLRRRFIVHHEK